MADESAISLSPEQVSMVDYWQQARGDLATPLLDALDPLKFDRRALPYLIVADYLDDRGLVQFRLVGEEMVQRWGANFRGRRSDEMFKGDYRVHVERCFALARAERCPVYSESIFRWDAGGWIRTTRVMLPFSAEPDGVPVRVAVVQLFMPGEFGDVVPDIRLLRAVDMIGGIVVPLPDARRCTGGV